MPPSAVLCDTFASVTRGRVKFNEPMGRHTTFHIGGPAEIWVEPQEIREMEGLLRIAQEERLPVTVVGGGANLLVRDEGIPGLVVHLAAPGFQRFERSDDGWRVGAGLPLEWLIRRAQEAGLSGVEFLAGVPGRVGGAVRMNAGTHDERGENHSMGDVIKEVAVLDPSGRRRVLSNGEIGFSYRSTGLGDRIAVEALLALTPDDPQAIAARVERNWAFKRSVQDWSAPSVGCIFKNPRPPHSAGWLIDQAGLKGFRVGGAIISPVHANFILNLGDARARDVLALVEEARARVQKQFGIDLELEVQVLPTVRPARPGSKAPRRAGEPVEG